MYVIAICGPIGADIEQLSIRLSEVIKSTTKVEIIAEKSILDADGKSYNVGDLVKKMQQHTGVILLTGHYFFKDNALVKAFNSALCSKEEQQPVKNLLKLFLKTASDTCYARYVLASLATKQIKQPTGEDHKRIYKEYTECVKSDNDEKINPSIKQADVIVPDGKYNSICELIDTKVKSMFKEEPEPESSKRLGLFS